MLFWHHNSMASNAELASFLTAIADILDIRDDNAFRVRAYRNAARTIEGLTEPLTEIAAHNPEKLAHLPGIGKGMHAKIIEYCQHGRLSEYDELMASTPAGLIEMLNLPSFGPKRVKLVYDKLGIDSVAALEAAAAAGEIQKLPGMGAKTEANLLRVIREYRSLHTDRMPWSRAREILDDYLAHLRAVPGVDRLEPAGSFRRCRDTVGDLDILVTTHADADVQPIIAAFTTYRDVADVLARGDTKASVILQQKIQVDLRVVDTASFGAASQYFTGSKEHNVALRSLAKEMGLKLSEYGVFRGATSIAGASEREVYAALGLPLIPPELREQRGEIEAARAGTLPALVELDDLKGDLHAHSNYSDGALDIAAMARAAQACGYAYLAITDHSKLVTVAHGLDEAAVLRQLTELERVRAEVRGIHIFSGIEVDILRDGTLDLSDEILGQLDFVIASAHYSYDLDAAAMTARVIRAVRNPHVDCLAHPLGRRTGTLPAYKLDFPAVIEAARACRVAFEINAAPDRLDLDELHADAVRRAGVPLVINTDAHTAANFAHLRNGLNIARRAWCSRENILNTWPLKDLLAWIASAPS
jgi:DNA polymerase (family 10)